MQRQRAVVVGGGVNGLSIARALAERGVHDVLLLERRTLASGGTGKSSGIVRCHYGVPSLAAMAWRSLPLLESLADEIGFHQVGYLVTVGPQDEDALRANVAMQQRLGIDVSMTSMDVASGLWPHMQTGDLCAAALEPRGGYADASQLALHFAARAREAGATIRQGHPVSRLVTRGEQIVGLELSSGERIDADVVVIAAGVWSADLLGGVDVDVPLRGLRAGMLLMDAGKELGELPVLSDLESVHYVRAEGSGRLLVGNSDHSAPVYMDADSYVDRMTNDELEEAVGKALHRFVGLPDARVTTTYVGCYDITPDWNPVISSVPVDGVYVAAGFSGHGFKISPAVGDLVADLVLEGDSRDPVIAASDFRLSRFDEGKPLKSLHPYAGASLMR
ncbi:MAG TPA: FAD-dependent oxidoreductase [Nocardioides sp.]|uniref:NAD(P)/FAD-dependent oxidoreductase n=1 Tax=uncultured Nocardioides sp. TaxID=198441 RepID=UPI0026073F73|nr:FAD-dependent oxidoreductase [uncultured Nocardioides sp.]HRI95002.1 FAD-dependent oxidoreductase [Nocardioides sp.]HRK44270.1 FAD-dependent oxidoreductase [Nocardioides sp.]